MDDTKVIEEAEMATVPGSARRPLPRVQRQLLAFGAVFIAWLVISALLMAVGIAGGGAAAQYALGALVILLIPAMLVMLFILLRHALADERHREAVPEPLVTRDAVRAAIVRDFPDHDPTAVLVTLDAATANVPFFDRTAVQHAIVVLSEGDIARLRYLTEAAGQDYRDLLGWADEMTASRERARSPHS